MITSKTIVTVVVIALTTFLTRVLPFMLFPGNKETPPYIRYLGKVLPYAVMAMLVIYCLKAVNLFNVPFGLPEFIAIAAVIIVHKWKHNLLISIAGGTILYMVLVQVVFK